MKQGTGQQASTKQRRKTHITGEFANDLWFAGAAHQVARHLSAQQYPRSAHLDINIYIHFRNTWRFGRQTKSALKKQAALIQHTAYTFFERIQAVHTFNPRISRLGSSGYPPPGLRQQVVRRVYLQAALLAPAADTKNHSYLGPETYRYHKSAFGSFEKNTNIKHGGQGRLQPNSSAAS